MRPDLNTCSTEHHSGNDSSSSTSWSDDSHVFSHNRTLVVPGTVLRVLYNIHHHIAFARELEEKVKNTEQDQPAVRFIFLSCGIVYSRGNRTPESEKKQTSVYLIKRKMKKKNLVYVPGTYIALFVVALAAGVNSNPSSRDRFFLRTANPRQDLNSSIHG